MQAKLGSLLTQVQKVEELHKTFHSGVRVEGIMTASQGRGSVPRQAVEVCPGPSVNVVTAGSSPNQNASSSNQSTWAHRIASRSPCPLVDNEEFMFVFVSPPQKLCGQEPPTADSKIKATLRSSNIFVVRLDKILWWII